MCSIDIIIRKSDRWTLKSHLESHGIEFMEWFFESVIDRCIITLRVSHSEGMKTVYEFLRYSSPDSMIVLPDGRRVRPGRSEYSELERYVKVYFEKE